MQKHTKTREDLIPDQFDVSFKALAEMSPAGVHITDAAGKCLYVNPAWCGMAGLTIAEAMGDGWIKAIHPQDRSRLFSEWESFIKGANNWESEYRFVDNAGKITWVYGTATLLKGSKGLVENIIGITINITERKKYETRLKESEERLRLASKAAGFGTYSYEFENGKAYYSDEFLALFGLFPGKTLELDSNLVATALHPEDKARFLLVMKQANDPEGDGILDLEYRIIHKNGDIRWLKTRGLTVFSGKGADRKPLQANGIVQDITNRKNEEAKLSELSERCRLITEYSGLGIGYYDIEGKILLFNEEALKNLGGKSEDYIGKNIVDVFGKEAGTIYINRFKNVAESEIPLQFEDCIELDGRPGWYLSTHNRILNKNGVLDGIQVISENITERKIAELALIQNEEQLKLIFSTMTEGVALNEIMFDGKGRMIDYKILKVNEAFYKIADYKKHAVVVGNTATEIYGMSGESITSWWRKHKSKDKTVFTEFKSPLSNRWYVISTSPFSGNKFVTTFRDITERKRTEERIRTASQYARTLIEASLDPLVTISSEGKITDVNIATEKVTGFKRERLIGSEFADYFVESDKAREGYNIVFSKGVVKDYPLTIRHKNGRMTDVLYNATLFKNDEGVVQGVFAAARDITLRKRMETKLKNSAKLLEKLNKHLNEVRERERSEIALNLHDDLGQRLTAFCLDLAWLKSRIGVQSDPVRNKLEEMIREINETIEGIKELSSFLRPTILYDLGLVPAIISQLDKFEKQSGIKCSFYFDSEEFNSDEKISLIFYRIIQESLTNIARHSGASAMELNLKKHKDAIEMVIKDDGVGIDNEKVNYLTSMGLEGIRERVKTAHGEVSIKGEKGSGTTIMVTIPIKKRRR